MNIIIAFIYWRLGPATTACDTLTHWAGIYFLLFDFFCPVIHGGENPRQQIFDAIEDM